MKKLLLISFSAIFVLGLVVAYYFLRRPEGTGRDLRVIEWLRSSVEHPDWKVLAGTRCNGAPFSFPTDGYIAYLWGDSFRPGHQHQGIDIFGGTEPGQTKVFAAYGGYLTRLNDWKSSLIIRVPEDPLRPGRQIWTYYTHFADSQGNSYIDSRFPPGTVELPVTAGDFLGFQGNYSGTSGNPVGVHLHFSIVRDDGQGQFLNELDIDNTIDPSLYFGIVLNTDSIGEGVPSCEKENSANIQS